MLRVRKVLREMGEGMAATGRVLASLTEEIAVLIGLVLIAVGFWDLWRPGSFLAPGIVLLWLFVPQRKSFIHKPQTVMQPRRRKDSN